MVYEAFSSQAISITRHFVFLVWIPLIKISALTSCGIHLGGGEYVLQSDLATPPLHFDSCVFVCMCVLNINVDVYNHTLY